jgi:DNA-binding response OmpR family regulator
MPGSADPKPVDRKYKLLMADLDAAFCVTATSALADHGHELTPCRDGETAWRLANEREFDVVMIDLAIPKINGLEFISRCRESEMLSDLPIIALSEATDEDLCNRALGLGASTYLLKPVSLQLLSHTVWNIIRNKARDEEMKWLKLRLGFAPDHNLELAS